MSFFRKTLALLLLISALFIGFALALAMPADPVTALILAVMAAAILASAFFTWPRRTRSPLVDQLINDPSR